MKLMPHAPTTTAAVAPVLVIAAPTVPIAAAVAVTNEGDGTWIGGLLVLVAVV